ncbi:clasp N terminal-domain-containing protein [Mucor lusitanicus]|uniref:Clasp N terminal-domain-containing protein n=1 Tax=Mucor circinelloides f. lusitanicus TaxID=29924 RepID=A0A8H4F8Q1_MUCCL|nr:clasp N terminal-domain-containing protein [Mucor lusitanicus]
MTIHKDESTDVDPVQIWSAKDLEAEFNKMLKAYHDKETEFNWEARDQAITRLRGILRGNATESPYLEVLMPCMKQMVDGIVKAVESLRTQLAVKALLLVTDIGIYIGRHLDNYTTDQILLCMMRCSSLTKKMVASASLETTKSFLKHTQFYPKITNMLHLSMNEKNSQVRLYAMVYTKTLLQTHAHHDRTRQTMDRSHSTEQCETILVKGLNDPIPAVKEVCREAFWIFWEHWRDRGEGILRQLPPAAQKQLEKSKTTAPKANTTRSMHSPTISPRASSSLGRHRHHDLSPSTSSASNGSLKRSMSPANNRAVSPPHLRSPPPPSSISSQMQQEHHPPPAHKTRVPTLNRKKSAVSLIKRKPTSNFMNLITSDDVFQRGEGIVLLAKKLAPFPPSFDTNNNNNNEIQLDVPNSPPVSGDQLRTLVVKLWDDHYPEPLFSWDAVTCIMFRLLTFEEYIPKLILEANADGKSEHDLVKQQLAQMGLVRAKLFLQSQHPALVDTLFNSLIQYGNFASTTHTSSSFDRVAIGSKKDMTRLPANRRKLTRQFLEWMDELVTPLIGLSEDVDVTARAFEGVPAEYVDLVSNRDSHAAAASATSEWFESDDNIRQCLAILLPLITTSTSGTMWHAPLVTFIKHIRLLNQRLFEMVTTTYDDYSVNKICRVLGIHIRIEPPLSIVPQQQLLAEEPMMAAAEDDEPLFEAETLPPAPLMESSEPPVAVDEVLFDDPPLHASSSDSTSQPLIDAPLVDRLTIQENNDILDHDADLMPSSTVAAAAATATHFDHRKEQDEIPIPDYFSPKQNVVDVMYTHDTDGSPTASILDGRTVSGTSTSTKTTKQVVSSSPLLPPIDAPQPVTSQSEKSSSEPPPPSTVTPLPQSGSEYVAPSPPAPTAAAPTSAAATPPHVPAPTTQLLPSEPNLETYPLPTHVPFFAPEKVNFPNPVFRSNVRANIVAASQSTTTTSTTTNGTSNARHLKDKTTLLYTLIDKLNSATLVPPATTTAHADTFRKLTRLFKEVPIRRRWDQGGIEETGSETWAGALGDAGNFVETVQAILPHLDNNIVALECIRQLAVTQTGLFRYYERKLDDQGKSLESQLMEKLLDIRCNDNPTICVAAEDALDAVLGTLNPPTAFEMLMAFVIYRLLILPCSEELTDVRYHPVGSAFTYLGKWVKEMNETFYIDEWLSKRGGVNAIFKASVTIATD